MSNGIKNGIINVITLDGKPIWAITGPDEQTLVAGADVNAYVQATHHPAEYVDGKLILHRFATEPYAVEGVKLDHSTKVLFSVVVNNQKRPKPKSHTR